MLLPFAGFLYGSAFGIQALSRNPVTAPLTHFVFPVLTLWPVAPILSLLGLGLFLASAVQIYAAKIRKSGIVTTGLYGFVRHPQYVALTLFGGGLLLTWGRLVAYVAFFLMMFLYYWLAKHEESRCAALFGEDYERYRERTSFILPGDRALRGLCARLRISGMPAAVRGAIGFALTALACFGSILLIDAVKDFTRVVPYLTASVEFSTAEPPADGIDIVSAETAGVAYVRAGRVVVVRGPWRNASAPGFAEGAILRLRESAALREYLAFLDVEDGDSAVVFCIPYRRPETPGRSEAREDTGRRGPPPTPEGPHRVRLFILRVTLEPGRDLSEVFADRTARRILGAAIAPVNLAAPPDLDIVDGDVFRPGPMFPGEERFAFILSQLAEQREAGDRPAPPAMVPGRSASSRLVMVKAPILRTRIDPDFAKEIFDRLLASETFRAHLARTGAGGEVVPVAFPRPGPNWYREHHGQPQISVFVVLARPTGADTTPDALFRTGGRELLGAFTALLDFRIGPPADSVGEIAVIGPYRDLEERFAFFLSGI